MSTHFICSQCRMILSETERRSHISAEHLDYFPFGCTLCKHANKKHLETTKEDMDEHIATYHNGNNLGILLLEDKAKEVELNRMIEQCQDFKQLNGAGTSAGSGNTAQNGSGSAQVKDEIGSDDDIIIIDDDSETAAMPNNPPHDNLPEQPTQMETNEPTEHSLGSPITENSPHCENSEASNPIMPKTELSVNISTASETFSISNIATMGYGTLVESFKFLNYFQLAKNSLASKTFRDVIRMHRHNLALLSVIRIDMLRYAEYFPQAIIHIFGKYLSSEEYNAWIVRNQYSKQIPPEFQVGGMESRDDDRRAYRLKGWYKVNPNLQQSMYVFNGCAAVNHENWPVFEHFVRLLTDPFISVHSMELPTRNDILHLLEKAMNPDRSRLQCDNLWLYLEGYAPKFISWIKDNVRCDRLYVLSDRYSNELNYDRELLDLFMSGANCSSEVRVFLSHSFPKIVDDFVQKFLDLKECDEYQIVQTIGVYNASIDELKKKYSEFIVKKKLLSDGITNYTFEFVNDNIGEKLKLTTFKIKDDDGYHLSCSVSYL